MIIATLKKVLDKMAKLMYNGYTVKDYLKVSPDVGRHKTKGKKNMKKTTLNELKNNLGILDSVFEVEQVLKRICKVRFDTALTDDQWIATLGFIEDNYKYTTATAMLVRLRRRTASA